MNKEEKLKKEQKAKEINKLKGLRITLIVFIIILLSLISFVGIYVKDKNEMSDVIPDFILGSDIEGNRIIQLNVEQDETITLTDSTGAKIASGTEEELSNQGYTEDVITKNGYTKSSEETNKAENLTAENYEKSKQILINRLKTSGVTDYKVRQDKDNGNIVVELKEDDSTDDIISTLSEVGKFELKDSETEEILLNNDDVKDAKVLYNNTQSGVNVYLEIEFNKQGKEKLQEISRTYNSNAVSEDTTNTVSNNTSSSIKKDILYKTKTKVEEFMVHISNEEYEDAFNMLDENCKINTFNNNLENFKKIILEKYFNPDKAERKYTIESEDTKARYEYNDIYNYYTVTVYSPELSGSDYYNPSNEGKNYNFSETFYKQREIKIDVLDIEPYNFKLIVQFKD